ncbi:hypothetical protein ACSS6W_001108 [Trichoderma asperelloides]
MPSYFIEGPFNFSLSIFFFVLELERCEREIFEAISEIIQGCQTALLIHEMR